MIYAENILLCITIPLIVSLFFVKNEVRWYVAAFILGMVMCLLAAYISGYINALTGMGEADTRTFISPVIEEFMKMLPLISFMVLLSLPEKNLTMFAVAIGAGFATFENCCYVLSLGAGSLRMILIRGMAVGVMHIVSILAMSVWLQTARQLNAFSFSAVVGGLAIAMIFHAIYNLLVSASGVFTVIGYLLPLMGAVVIYILYRKTISHKLS